MQRLALGAQSAGNRRIARQVDSLLDRHDRRHRDDVDVAPAGDLLLAAEPVAFDRDPLDAGDARQPERVRDPDRDLVVAGVGGLVSEQDQVVGLGLRLDRPHDRGGGRLWIPFAAVGHEMDRLVDPDRHHVAQLLLGLRRAERQHGARAAVLLDQADRLLGAALLVRADREPEVSSLDRLLVVGQGDLAAGQRHALDADEDVHERTRELSGSKIGVEPATATVTGYCSPMYCTSSCSPSLACSGGR